MDAANLELERQCVQDAMASIAYDVPLNPLYYESNIEVYRVGNFDGFVDDGSGSLLNPRSIASAARQEKSALRSRFIGLSMTGLSNSTRVVTVRVMNQNNNPIRGAEVTLESSAGHLLSKTGITDQYGQISTNFTAPNVPLVETYNNWEAVRIRIVSATLGGYRPAPAVDFIITIFPERVRTMFMEATVNPDVITGMDGTGNAGFANLQLFVKDMGGMPLDGVKLRIQASDANVTLSASAIETDSGGSATIRVYAPDLGQTLECRITINAIKGGFFNASQEITIVILPSQPEPAEASEPLINKIAIPMAIVFISSALIGATYIVRRRRRK
jgi:hypothetical protein